MKTKLPLSLLAAATLAFSSAAFAAGAKTYQVTGPVLEVTDSMIAVQKGKDRWEVNRDANTKVTGDLKVGEKVTVTYTMSATDRGHNYLRRVLPPRIPPKIPRTTCRPIWLLAARMALLASEVASES